MSDFVNAERTAAAEQEQQAWADWKRALSDAIRALGQTTEEAGRDARLFYPEAIDTTCRERSNDDDER